MTLFWIIDISLSISSWIMIYKINSKKNDLLKMAAAFFVVITMIPLVLALICYFVSGITLNY